MTRVIVFDVNETLLDLAALDSLFIEIFGVADVRETWFAQLITTAMTATITDHYRDFAVLARGALKAIAAARAKSIDEAALNRFGAAMQDLPPYQDAVPALERLREAGLRLAALTNSSQAAAVTKLTHAGLFEYFERILSVEAVRCFKPAAATYQHAASSFGVETAALTLVAAHDWDVIGAMRAGCRGAFVSRAGKLFDPYVRPPDFIGMSLTEVADAIIKDIA